LGHIVFVIMPFLAGCGWLH